MKNTKLIHIFKQLSEEEFKKLGKFAHSPYFNSNKALPKLYEFFAPFYPDFDSKKMNHEDAFNFIYEKKGANISKKIVDLMSDMYKLVAKYIQQLEYEKDEIGKQKYMAEAWADKKYFHLFEKELDNLKEKIEKAPYRDLQYYYNRYDIENRKYLRASVGQIEYSKDSLETMKESLGGVFDFGQLKVNLEMHSRKNLLGESFESLDSLE